MKYTFTLTEEGWEREKIVLESRAGESDRHIALKVLAYLLYRGDARPLPLEIERRVGQRHKPDLVAVDREPGVVRLWVDCGQIETERLGRIVAKNPDARVVVVKPTENEARLYAAAARKDVLPEGLIVRRRPLPPDSIEFVGFDPNFLPRLLASLRGTNAVNFSRGTDDKKENVVLAWNGEEVATQVHRLHYAP